MKKQHIWKWLTIILVIALLIGNLLIFTAADVSAVEQAEPLPAAVAQNIRQATIQITMFHTYMYKSLHASGDFFWQEKVITNNTGIGTLLNYQDHTLLISHDHWPQLNSTTILDVVQFHDADGRFLLEMTGQDFQQLIFFHNGGILVMRAPQPLTTQLPSAATIDDVTSLKPGAIVFVAHHQAKQSDLIALMAAEVVAIESRDNIPFLLLRSLNGQSIEPGDSGGGVWLNGRFIGNLWMTVRVERRVWWRFYQPREISTTFSYAAGLTAGLLSTVTLALEPSQPPVQSCSNPPYCFTEN